MKNKGKEKHLNLTREMKMYNLQGRIIKLMADSSMEMMETKKKWRKYIFEVLKEKEMPKEILYLMKMSFKNKDEIMMLLDKEKIFQQQHALK